MLLPIHFSIAASQERDVRSTTIAGGRTAQAKSTAYATGSAGASLRKPSWRPGEKVRWRDCIGKFRRDLGDGEHAEILIFDRTYRVRLGDLA